MTRPALRFVCFAATLAILLGASHLVGEAIRDAPRAPFAVALTPHSYLAPTFIIPLVIAWFMPDWRWLLGYASLMAVGFLSGLALGEAAYARNLAMPESIDVSTDLVGDGDCETAGRTCTYNQFWVDLTGEVLPGTNSYVGPPRGEAVERSVATSRMDGFTRYEIVIRHPAEGWTTSRLYQVAAELKDSEDRPLAFECVVPAQAAEIRPMLCRTAYRLEPKLFVDYSFEAREADFAARARAIDGRVRTMLREMTRRRS